MFAHTSTWTDASLAERRLGPYRYIIFRKGNGSLAQSDIDGLLGSPVYLLQQQIMHYYNCSRHTSLGAKIPRTNYYQYETGDYAQCSMGLCPAVQRGINAGIFSSGGVPSIDCATGNCTWPSEYSTVGWCSACHDITDLLVFEDSTIHENSTKQTYTGRNHSTSLPHTGISVSMAPPAKDAVDVAAELAAMSLSYDYTDTSYALQKSFNFVLGKNIEGTQDPVTLYPWPDCNSATTNATWRCQGYGAARCDLFACVKTFTASVQAGKLTETLVDSASNWLINASNSVATLLDNQCLDSHERQALRNLGYKIEDNERWIPYNMTWALS